MVCAAAQAAVAAVAAGSAAAVAASSAAAGPNNLPSSSLGGGSGAPGDGDTLYVSRVASALGGFPREWVGKSPSSGKSLLSRHCFGKSHSPSSSAAAASAVCPAKLPEVTLLEEPTDTENAPPALVQPGRTAVPASTAFPCSAVSTTACGPMPPSPPFGRRQTHSELCPHYMARQPNVRQQSTLSLVARRAAGHITEGGGRFSFPGGRPRYHYVTITSRWQVHPSMRRILVTWLVELYDELELPPKVLVHAVFQVDRCCPRPNPTPPRRPPPHTRHNDDVDTMQKSPRAPVHTGH